MEEEWREAEIIQGLEMPPSFLPPCPAIISIASTTSKLAEAAVASCVSMSIPLGGSRPQYPGAIFYRIQSIQILPVVQQFNERDKYQLACLAFGLFLKWPMDKDVLVHRLHQVSRPSLFREMTRVDNAPPSVSRSLDRASGKKEADLRRLSICCDFSRGNIAVTVRTLRTGQEREGGQKQHKLLPFLPARPPFLPDL